MSDAQLQIQQQPSQKISSQKISQFQSSLIDKMQENQDDPLLLKIKESKLYWKLRKNMLEFFKNDPKMIYSTFKQKAKENGTENKITFLFQNQLLNQLQPTKGNTSSVQNNIFDFLNDVKSQWTSQIHQQLVNCSKEILKDTSEKQINCIFDEKMLLNFLIKIQNSENLQNIIINKDICQIKVKIPTESFQNLRMKFDPILNKKYKQHNLRQQMNEKSIDQIEELLNAYQEEEEELRHKRAKRIYKDYMIKFYKKDIEKICKYGITANYRRRLYNMYFNIESNNQIFNNIDNQIQNNNLKYTHFFECILEAEANAVQNDEQYFVFMETIQRILYVFFKDEDISKEIKVLFTDDFMSLKEKSKLSVSGVLPCKFFFRYVSPFCFLSQNISDIYILFRSFYCEFFCYLHSISSHSNSILGILLYHKIIYQFLKALCLQLEDLLKFRDDQLFIHLQRIQNNNIFIECPALKVSFPWLFYCFIGYLAIDQVFLILDFIIGYQDLQILPLVASSILYFYSDKLLKCSNMGEIDNVFQHLDEEINIIYCINHFFDVSL